MSKLNRASSAAEHPIQLDATGEALGLLHDLGKYSRSFQDYLGSAVGLIDQDADAYVDADKVRGRIDHSTAGAQYIWQHLCKAGPVGALSGQILAVCLASHHSGLIDCITPDGLDNFTRRVSKPEEDAHLARGHCKRDPAVLSRLAELAADDSLTESITRFVRGVVEQEHNFERSPVVVQFKIGLLTRLLFSCSDRCGSGRLPRTSSVLTRGAFASRADTRHGPS